MIGQNFGRALMSIGEDVSQFGIAQLRAESQKELLQARLEYQNTLNQLRMGAAANRPASGAGNGFVPNSGLSEEVIAAMSGQTVPEFRAGRDFNRSGPMAEVKATADSAGMEYLDPADRRQLEAAGGMTGETQASMFGRGQADKSRGGLIASSISPQYLDQFEKGRTTAAVRDRALDPAATPAHIGDLNARVKAMDGKDQFAVQGNTKIDTSRGNTETTEVGRSEIRKNDAKASSDRALAGQRDRGESTDDRKRIEALDTAINKAEQIIEKYTKDRSRMRRAQANPDSEEGREYRAAVTRRNALQSERDKLSPPGAAPAPAPASGSRRPLDSFDQ